MTNPALGGSCTHYDSVYFDWQKSIGAFGGRANLFKFCDFIAPGHAVLDFGCGGGYLLNHLSCERKVGFEINPEAIKVAREHGLTTVSSFDVLGEDSFDRIISNHALEHLVSPFDAAKRMLTKLKPGGLAIHVTPYEDQAPPWRPNDRNQHLYTWAPMNLGNLFAAAGYRVRDVEILRHTWPPDYQEIVKQHGWEVFHDRCRAHSAQEKTLQLRIVAERAN